MKTALERIEARAARIGVVGLGYVGLPVACSLADAGFSVVGIDRNESRVRSIADGRSVIEGDEPGLNDLLTSATQSGRLRVGTDPALLGDADVFIVAVDTAVDALHRPDLEPLRSAVRAVAAGLRHGSLVIVESTLAPGTMDREVIPLLETLSRLHVNADVLVGHCPERVMPGKLLRNLRTMPRVCGGSSAEATAAMFALYRTIVTAELQATDLVSAEIVKTAENAFRDVNIAFANELALVCEELGADVWEVRRLVNMSPGRLVLEPGAGVGGHCIPKDPWLLIANTGADRMRLIPAARSVNDGMPAVVAGLLEDLLRDAGLELRGSRIAILGFAYLADSGDVRNSPSATMREVLASRDVDVSIHDPYVEAYRGEIGDALEGVDAAVVMVAHTAYRALPWSDLRKRMRRPLILDARNVLDADDLLRAGLTIRCLGRPTDRSQAVTARPS